MKYLIHAFNSSCIEILHQTHTPRRPHHLTGNMKYKKKKIKTAKNCQSNSAHTANTKTIFYIIITHTSITVTHKLINARSKTSNNAFNK